MRKHYPAKSIEKCRFIIYACTLLLMTASVGAGQTAEKKLVETIPVDAESIQSLIENQLSKDVFVGGSIAVMNNGKIVYAKGFGKRSLENNRSVDIETRFNIGSVSKQFTCAAVLLLAEQGKLSINDEVSKYFPDLKEADKISLLDLMNHVSGYADYYPLDFLDRRMLVPVAPDKIITTYAGQKLDFEPGSEFSYSNTNYVILGRVVEKISGKSLARFFAERFFKPLKLKNTVFEPSKRGALFADGYTSYALSDPELAPNEGKGWSFGAGGIFSTATDLAKWDLALMEGKVLKPESLKAMTTRRELSDGTIKNYGCGLELETVAGDTIWTHGGATSGFTARNTMIPSTKSALVILSNADFALPGAVLHGKFLQSLVIKKTVNQENKTKPTPAQSKPKSVEVKGMPAAEAAKSLFLQIQSGKLNRSLLGEEFNDFLSERKLRNAHAKLKSFGEPMEVKVFTQPERGGMEASALQFVFASGKLNGFMFRSIDGKIQEFSIRK